MELCKVEWYWETRVELIFALKENATSYLMAIPEVKLKVPEGEYVVVLEGDSLGKPKNKVPIPASVSTLSHILLLSHYA